MQKHVVLRGQRVIFNKKRSAQSGPFLIIQACNDVGEWGLLCASLEWHRRSSANADRDTPVSLFFQMRVGVREFDL